MSLQIEELKDQVRKVIAYSQGLDYDKVNVDSLLDDWKENKYKFYCRMPGQKLIYESHTTITVPVSTKDKMDELANLIDTVYWSYKNADLSDFIQYFTNDFYDNVMSEEYKYKDTIIPKGMKIIKAFKYFVEDKDELNKLQDKASMLIQSTKITGRFCLSVHPLDYLSLSENNHNWRSCHALDGEYRTGDLSYMTDKSTIIFYIKSEEPTTLPHFPAEVPWNNKKWRMLIHVSNDDTLLIAGRQYPYESQPLLENALELYRTFFADGRDYTDWSHEKYDEYKLGEKYFFTKRMLPIGNELKAYTDVIVDCETPLHYNDPLHSTVYDFWFSEEYNRPYWYENHGDIPNNATINFMTNKNTKVNIGHKVKCCVCGEQDCVLSETMMCIDCEVKYGKDESDNFTFCRECGRRVYIPEAIELDDDDGFLCKDCGSHLIRCSNCWYQFDENDIIHDEITNTNYCRNCYNEILFDRGREEEE